jgi:hypothetical protein
MNVFIWLYNSIQCKHRPLSVLGSVQGWKYLQNTGGGAQCADAAQQQGLAGAVPQWIARHPPPRHISSRRRADIRQHRSLRATPTTFRQPPISNADDTRLHWQCFQFKIIVAHSEAAFPTPQRPPTQLSFSASQRYQPTQRPTQIQIPASRSQPWKTTGPSPRATTPATGGIGCV